METTDHSNYELFPNSTGSLSSQAYRTNASSSSSLGHNYGMNSDNIYSHPQFSESVPSFASSNSSNPYDIIGLPSSYNSSSSGKVSPLTPSDPVSGFNAPHDFPPALGVKDFQPSYPEIERRLPGAGYSPAYEEYGMNNINPNVPYPASGLQPYQERLGRFPPEHRYHHSGPVPNMSHIQPHAALPYDPMHYPRDGSQDMSLRMASVDETLANIRLHPMGQSNDLQTFIRYASSSGRLKAFFSFFQIVLTLINMSVLPIGSPLAKGQSLLCPAKSLKSRTVPKNG